MKNFLVLSLLILFCSSTMVLAYPNNTQRPQKRTRPVSQSVSSNIASDLGIQQLTYTGNSGSIKYGEKFINKNQNGETHLILILHGRAGMGSDNTSQLENPAISSLANYAQKNGKKIIILAPQCPQGNGWTRSNDGNSPINIAVELVKQKMKTYNISPTISM